MFQHRRVIVSAVALLLVFLMTGGMAFSAYAESSSTIKARIESLKEQEQEIAAQKAEVRAQREANESDILDLVDQKNQIDQQLMLTHNDIETKNELIREYNLLIAEKQNELGDAIAQRDALNAQYKLRIRAMEERGTLSYWSILFRANSFADLLDRVEMINEIARADSKMIQRLQDSAQQIEAVRQELAAEKVEMEEAKEALAAEQEAMENERMESDKLMAELMADHEEYAAAERKYQAEQADLQAQIASEQSKYHLHHDRRRNQRQQRLQRRCQQRGSQLALRCPGHYQPLRLPLRPLHRRIHLPQRHRHRRGLRRACLCLRLRDCDQRHLQLHLRLPCADQPRQRLPHPLRPHDPLYGP